MRKENQGMNWIRKAKRLAIYGRDGLECVYCGRGVEDVERMTLDHVVPVSDGGGNDSDNLVTACVGCNSAKGDRDFEQFVAAVADYLDIEGEELFTFIVEKLETPLDMEWSKSLLENRAPFRQVCINAACNQEME